MPYRLASPKQHSLALLYTEAVPPPPLPLDDIQLSTYVIQAAKNPRSTSFYILEKPGAAEGFPKPAKRVTPGEGENMRQRCAEVSCVDKRPTPKHYSYHQMVTTTLFGKRKDERGKNTNNTLYTRRTITIRRKIRRPVQTQRPTRGVGAHPFRIEGHPLDNCPRCG